MSPSNELFHQIVSLKDHIHISYIEEYFEKWCFGSVPMVNSERQAALFNQCLLEYFELNISGDPTVIDNKNEPQQPWDFQYIALLPSDILNRTLALWSACVHAQKLDRYIVKEDINKIRKLFSDNYQWLSCSSLSNPDHPKEMLQYKLASRSPKSMSSCLPVDQFLNEYLVETSFLGARYLSKDWSLLLKRLLLLKIPKTSIAKGEHSDILDEVSVKDIESTIMICLEKVSTKWHEKFLLNSAPTSSIN